MGNLQKQMSDPTDYTSLMPLYDQLRLVQYGEEYTCRKHIVFRIDPPRSFKTTYSLEELHQDPTNEVERSVHIVNSNNRQCTSITKLFIYEELVKFLIDHGIDQIDQFISTDGQTLKDITW